MTPSVRPDSQRPPKLRKKLGCPPQPEVLRPMRELEPAMDTFASLTPSGLSAIHMDPPVLAPYAGEGGLLADFPPRLSMRCWSSRARASTPR